MWISNPATRSDWALGKLSIKETLANGFYWNPYAGEEVFRFSYYSDDKNFVNIYYSGQWVNINKPAGQGGERDWLDKTQIGMESYGFAHSFKKQLIDFAAKTDPSINNLKYVKGVKVVGIVLVVGGVVATGYEVYDDVFNKGNYYSAGTRAAVLGIGLAATAIPVAGWAVAGGIGLEDAIWGDQFYNWVELNLRKEP